MRTEDLAALWDSYEQRKSGGSGLIYLKSILGGLVAMFAAGVLMVIVVMTCLSIASRSSGRGLVGWDPISLAKPLTWFGVALAIFLAGFFSTFFRLSSK